MIKCDILNKSFESPKERLKAIQANKSLIINAKKAEIKTKSANFLGFYDAKKGAIKGLPDSDDNYIYPVISNTNYLDHHKDVHLTNSMNKTAKDQSGKVYYVADHELRIDSIIAEPKDVEVYIQDVNWSDIGKNYSGITQAMIFKIAKEDIVHDKFKRMIQKGTPLQNSIRMQYVKVDIGFNSNDQDFREEKAVFDNIYNQTANKDAFEENDVIFGVKELKIYMEGSAVLFGSNDATRTINGSEDKEEPTKTLEEYRKMMSELQDTILELERENIEPSKDTHKNEAGQPLQEQVKFYSNLI